MRLRLSNISLSDVNTKESWVEVRFGISWDKAWKNDVNCDGVWLFVKYRIADSNWRHATLREASSTPFNYTDQTPPNFSKGMGGESAEMGMWVPDTQKGAFIFRTRGIGNVKSDHVRLVWDYAKDGLRSKDIESVEVKVFGIEMVYVPADNHHVGDPEGPNGPDNCFYTYPNNGAYLITSEDAITADKSPGNLFCDQDNDRSRDAMPFVIPKGFPKGYKAFWCMKYGLSSQEYVDFLNTLTRKQQNAGTMTDVSTDTIKNYYVMTDTNKEYLRQSIVCEKTGNGTEKPVRFYTYAPARACNVLCWADVCAYAAWAALRPITELEYEKACRGPRNAIPLECAWGSTDIGRVDTFDGPDGSGYEKKIPARGIVNCCYGGGIAPFKKGIQKEPENAGFQGPVSCGLFANSRHEEIPERINDGASYYGIMELSGNLWEPCVTIGHPLGRAYTGLCGEGVLDEHGYANIPGWPDRTGAGAGARGGVWVSPEPRYLAVAMRFVAAHTKAGRRYNGGCRLGF